MSNNINTETWLPQSIKNLLQEGIFVAWKIKTPHFIFEKCWNGLTLLNDSYHIEILKRLIFNNTMQDYSQNCAPVDYVVIDKNGKILLKNFDVSVVFDSNGFIHISSNENKKISPYLAKPIPHITNSDCYMFFCGENFDAINNAVNYAIKNKWISTPKDFDKKKQTLKKKPISSPNEKSLI